MKAPQRTPARTDQMLGAMADILSSFALPSHQWLSDTCTEGGDGEGPEDSKEPQEEEDEEEEKDEPSSSPQSDTDPTRELAVGSPPEVFSPSIGRTRRLSDFRSCLSGDGLFSSEEESYSIAGSDGSISTSVASIQPQPSTSSAPSSPGSKRSVNTLKKWLTNPVRKLSTGSKMDRPVKKVESRPKRGGEGRRRRSADDRGRRSFDLGVLGKMEDPLMVLQDTKGLEWKGQTLPSEGRVTNLSTLNHLLQGETPEAVKEDPHISQPPVPFLPEDAPKQTYPAADSEEERKSALEKSMYVLMELIETEKMYVEDLRQIVEGYMATMSARGVPEDMKGKDKIVFGNIHQIYDWHKDYFLKELEKCLQDPDRLAHLFIKHERRLHMYVVYCQNKPKSEHIVSEYIDSYFEELKQQLGHRLQLNDLLIKPVQRIMKYQLLLKDFLKYYSKAGADVMQLEKAVEVMCFVPKRCNDMMNLGRLQGFEGKITAQGKLLQQDTFNVMEQDSGFLPRCKERRVFLFEQIIIFSEPIDKKKGFSLPGYIFKYSIKVSCLGLEECVDGDPCKFALTSRGADRSVVRYVLQALTADVSRAWVSDISQILETQRNFLNALQSPIEYQRRESKSNSLGRITSSQTTAFSSMRPHSSASMDRNKVPNLKHYNASLPSLYLPSPNRPDNRQHVNQNHSAQNQSINPDVILSPRALTPAHIHLNFPSSPEKVQPIQISSGITQSKTIARKPSESSFESPDYMRTPGASPQDDESPLPTARLAKLDEDEL
ncbi:rho guanine nucleotide exchange factor 25 isoform X2 [Microcaecilia unicolor]|uniref:Rho guanine nucleotide exchange factor 25 n=1 Tax=Microcaecilia unicolor TaxID=1415580 RepID=A0A6P7XQ11_9AMPH|nr:rho guanine nucleotide exchange factor 25 isoform X2 [Microcaecilia unicolor]